MSIKIPKHASNWDTETGTEIGKETETHSERRMEADKRNTQKGR